MTVRRRRPALLAALLVAGSVLPLPSLRAELSPEARRGRGIYQRGEGSSAAPITALMGDAEAPASVLTCANCHGHDGEGRPEGGVTPSAITWESLTKPYGVAREGGRSHPPYTAATLARAIVDGLDPAGNRLLVSMPRYRMAPGDLDDLLAFLEVLGREPEPGVTASTLTLGLLVPARPPSAEVVEEMRAVLEAYFDGVNAQGGVFNRRLELRTLRNPSTSAAARGEREGVFALVGGVVGERDDEELAWIEREGLPWVGPAALDPEAGSPASRFIFYLLSGEREQALALVNFATEEGRGSRAVVFHPDTGKAQAMAVRQRCLDAGWADVGRVAYAPDRPDVNGLLAAGKAAQARDVFFLGSGDVLLPLLERAAEEHWRPRFFALGSLAGREAAAAPAALRDRIFLTLPTLPLSPGSPAAREYFGLLERLPRSPPRSVFQLWAYAGARVLVEGLRGAGRQLNREKLITSLEGLYKYETGVMPAITYGPNRRVGALGAYVVRIDAEGRGFASVGGWTGVEP